MEMSPDLLKRYLAILGLAPNKPSMAALTELIRAHLRRIPFENISKLYYLKHRDLRTIPDLELFLDGIERHHFGGTCYSCNTYFQQLLVSLGYEADLCGADMNEPDVHLTIRVHLEGRPYLVDMGYAAPFTDPLPLDLNEDQEIICGCDRYVLKPRDERGYSRLELYRRGELIHGYVAKSGGRNISEFADAVADSFIPESTFMKSLLLVRSEPGSRLAIHNFTVIQASGGEEIRDELATRNDLIERIERHFMIRPSITADVLQDLTISGGAWG